MGEGLGRGWGPGGPGGPPGAQEGLQAPQAPGPDEWVAMDQKRAIRMFARSHFLKRPPWTLVADLFAGLVFGSAHFSGGGSRGHLGCGGRLGGDGGGGGHLGGDGSNASGFGSSSSGSSRGFVTVGLASGLAVPKVAKRSYTISSMHNHDLSAGGYHHSRREQILSDHNVSILVFLIPADPQMRRTEVWELALLDVLEQNVTS